MAQVEATAAGDASALLALLRLDRSVFPDSEIEPFQSILAAADAVDLGADDVLLTLRAAQVCY